MPGTTTNLGLRYPVASDAPDGAGAFYNLAQDIEDRFGRAAAAAAQLAAGTRVGQRALVGAVEYRWNGAAWQAWDSDWQNYIFNVEGFAGTANANGTNGWVFNFSQYKYTGGKIRGRFELYLVGPSPASTGQINVNLPVAQGLGSVPTINGKALKANNGPIYRIDGSIGTTSGASKIYTEATNTSAQQVATTYNVPFTWGLYDVLRMVFEWDPA